MSVIGSVSMKWVVGALVVMALSIMEARPACANAESPGPVAGLTPIEVPRGPPPPGVQLGPPRMQPPPPVSQDPDTGLGGKQVAMGLATLAVAGLLGSGLFVAADRVDSTALAYGALSLGVLAPAGVGVAVCKIGEGSKRYDGRCVPAIGGAYIGALGALPGTLLGALAACSSDSSSSGDDLSGLDDCFIGAAVGGALGYTIGTLIGAYAGWSIFKRPKPGTLRAALF